ncbi:LysR family transcriptional regulator [Gordonia otitidis]|uniref:LysR family transcriptional regulator n=1 Tax=Gordonia otitidis TaxID=249058 RepID=UPI001D14C274|nr:LysR substrate-binding domain-containing protein [Gordonia otitidis]UEA57556.1 LysR family transcriptional regulator [Gordonia otitidis]
MDLDLRKLRYFVAVADELHFGRAAASLHVAQPALSRQIRALEADLGVTLFDRDRRRTTLTDAGRQLHADAPALLEAATAATRKARAAAETTASITIGFMPGLTLSALLRRLRETHPAMQVRLLRTDWNTQTAVLRDGRVDISVVRLPVPRSGIHLRPWFREPRVAAIPAHHPLAGSSSIALADLAREHLLQSTDAVPEWQAVADEFCSGTPVPTHPQHSVEEKLELVAAEEGICILPLSTGQFYTRSDVAVVPIRDIPPNEVAFAWLTGSRSPQVRAVVDAATAERDAMAADDG